MRWRAGLAAALAGGAVAALLLAAGPAAADGHTMRITATALSPSTLTVRPADTVVFVNTTGQTWRVQVGSDYEVLLFPGQSSDDTGLDPAPYAATAVGTFRVVATSTSRQATGSIVVTAQTSPTPTRPAPTSPPANRPAPGPVASSAAPGGSVPSTSPPPGVSASSPAPRATPTSPSHPTASTAPPAPAIGLPTPAPSPTPPALTGTVQDLGGSGLGLPGAVGSVLVAGLLAAFARVLLAEPVDRAGRAVDGGGGLS